MPLEIVEVCLIANLQSVGPMYVSDTNKKIFDSKAGNLLAARLIITAGLGNSGSPIDKLHGPVPIPELELETEYEGYYLIKDLIQKPSPGMPFSTGKGSFITVIIIPADSKKDYRPFEQHIENIIKEHMAEISFNETFTGEIPSEVVDIVHDKLNLIYRDIESSFSLSSLFEANSLYDIGLIASLPDKIAKLIKKIIMHPDGLPINDIDDNNILKTLEQSGLVERDIRDDMEWIIPR